MGRASARSSTTTSALSRARILAIDWPVPGLAAAIAAALAFDDGGYFPPAWGWSALVLFWVAGLALFLRDRFAFGRLELAMLGSFAGLVAWAALSSAWSSSTERSIDRKSTRLNSSHEWISYAVFCLKKKNNVL